MLIIRRYLINHPDLNADYFRRTKTLPLKKLRESSHYGQIIKQCDLTETVREIYDSLRAFMLHLDDEVGFDKVRTIKNKFLLLTGWCARFITK